MQAFPAAGAQPSQLIEPAVSEIYLDGKDLTTAFFPPVLSNLITPTEFSMNVFSKLISSSPRRGPILRFHFLALCLAIPLTVFCFLVGGLSQQHWLTIIGLLTIIGACLTPILFFVRVKRLMSRIDLTVEQLNNEYRSRGVQFYAHHTPSTNALSFTTSIEIRRTSLTPQQLPIYGSWISPIHLIGYQLEPYFPSALEGVEAPDHYKTNILQTLTAALPGRLWFIFKGAMIVSMIATSFAFIMESHWGRVAGTPFWLLIGFCIITVVATVMQKRSTKGKLEALAQQLSAQFGPRGVTFTIPSSKCIEIRRGSPSTSTVMSAAATVAVPMYYLPAAQQQQQQQQQQLAYTSADPTFAMQPTSAIIPPPPPPTVPGYSETDVAGVPLMRPTP